MGVRIHENIRAILETTPGLTQKGLAERMGLNPAAVNRMLYGRRNIMAEEIPMIEDYLGVRLDLSAPAHVLSPDNVEYRQDAAHGARRGFSDVPPLPPPREKGDAGLRASSRVPVYGYATGPSQHALNFSNREAVDWAVRHPAQDGISNAFALYIFSDAMEPRYFPGELIYIHPGRPPQAGRDCVVEMKNGDACVCRYLSQSADEIHVAQFNPAVEKDIAKADIKAIYAVVGRG